MADQTSSSPIAVARELHAAIEAGVHGEQLRHVFTEDATTLEHPNLFRPQGRTFDLAHMLEGSEKGAALLSKQTYQVRAALELGDLAIMRVRWTGVVARDIGKFTAGQVLTAHIAQFIHVRDGRVTAIETYDCVEPF